MAEDNRKRIKFCRYCDGTIEWGTKVCPHCKETLELVDFEQMDFIGADATPPKVRGLRERKRIPGARYKDDPPPGSPDKGEEPPVAKPVEDESAVAKPVENLAETEEFPSFDDLPKTEEFRAIVEPIDEAPPVVQPVSKGPPVVKPVAKSPPVVKPVAKGPPVVKPVAKGPPVVKPVSATPPVVKPVSKGPPVVKPVSKGPPVVKPVAKGPAVVKPVSDAPPTVKPVSKGPPVVRPMSKGPPVVKPVEVAPPVVEPVESADALPSGVQAFRLECPVCTAEMESPEEVGGVCGDCGQSVCFACLMRANGVKISASLERNRKKWEKHRSGIRPSQIRCPACGRRGFR